MTEAAPANLTVGLFATPEALLRAARALRGQVPPGSLEAYAPHLVHGLDQALGLPGSPLSRWTLIMGLLGASAGYGLQYWTSVKAYPLLVSGKPPEAWVPFLPVMFELAVLFAALTAGMGMLWRLNGLPAFGHPMLATDAMRAITRDRYALSLLGEPATCRRTLVAAGAESIEQLRVAPEPAAAFPGRAAAVILASWLAAGAATWGVVKLFPLLPPMNRLDAQPRLNPLAMSRSFPDGRSLRAPVPGTVARDHLPLGVASPAAADELVNPLPRTPAVLADGRAAYQDRCALCHGPLGDGQGSLGPAYGASPANLLAEASLARSDGGLYWVIAKGKHAMPGHEAELDSRRRWAVVHYVRALQRAGHARAEDLPEGTP